MNELLIQMSMIGQGRDVEGWMDILILVVIAAVYGLGAIIKTAKSKKKEQEQSQQIQKPQKKLSKGGGGLFEQFVMEIKKAAEEARKGTETIKPSRISIQKIPPQQATLQKHPGQAQPGSQTQAKAGQVAKAGPVKPKRSRSIPKVESEFDKLAQLDKGIPGISTKVVGLPSKNNVKLAEPVEYMYLSDVLSDYYKDPEAFKKAILHYEILGKPLALRDTGESVIGL